MRFFKAFNLLHRRTKSATFVPSTGPTLDFTTTTKVRSSSFTLGSGDSSLAAPLSLFDLVTSNKPLPIPASFSHLDIKSDSDRVLGLWRSRRFSDRNSLASLQSSIQKEYTRLREAVTFWIQEYSKIQDLLKKCHAELVAERLKTTGLERKVDADRQEIMDLRVSLARCEKLAGTSRSVERLEDAPVSTASSLRQPRTRLPSVSSAADSQITLGASTKPRTLDEYSSALRMTLLTRKALRDQKKVSKYWKNLAVVDGQQNTVTPSVSTISSIRESLPAHRQAAVEALMVKRGVTARLGQLRSEDSLSEVPCSAFTDLSTNPLGADLTGTMATLPSSLSKSSEFSRLSPLASESMKQEVSLLFGSYNSFRRLSPSRSRSLEASKSISIKGGLSKTASHSLSIDSFGDLNALFQRAFGGVDKGSEGNQEQKNTTFAFQLSSSFPKNMFDASSSYLPHSSIPTDHSQTWVNIESIDSSMTFEPSPAIDFEEQPGLKQASKECTSRRSWQKFVAKSPVPNESSNERKRSEVILRKAAGGKENNGFAMSLPVFKRRNSRLPVPIFGKREREA